MVICSFDVANSQRGSHGRQYVIFLHDAPGIFKYFARSTDIQGLAHYSASKSFLCAHIREIFPKFFNFHRLVITAHGKSCGGYEKLLIQVLTLPC